VTAAEQNVRDDRALVARAARGDRHAFTELYDRHVRPVYWQAYTVVGDRDAAEDVTQEVFLTTWRKLGAIDLVDDSLLPWLLVTSRYTALNRHRHDIRLARRQDTLDADLADTAASVEDTLEAEAVRTEIEKCVASLSTSDRRLYELCINGEHSYAAAAAELGVSHGAVRNRLSRLRTQLRSDLATLRGPA